MLVIYFLSQVKDNDIRGLQEEMERQKCLQLKHSNDWAISSDKMKKEVLDLNEKVGTT